MFMFADLRSRQRQHQTSKDRLLVIGRVWEESRGPSLVCLGLLEEST
jgi:hypothetical protein